MSNTSQGTGNRLGDLRVIGHIRLGDIVYSTGTGVPVAADAHGADDCVYIRSGTGSLSTLIYVTVDTGANWTVKTVP